MLQASMLRVVVVATALSAASMLACEATTPGIGSAAPAEQSCLEAGAPGDTTPGGGGAAVSAATNGEAGVNDASGDGGAATSSDAAQTVGPDPVCATGR
ncbi:MAG: hypothetical protein JWP87_5452 [Labilithrix sp.]|jgi:hypothetical protein|nr:hypothetical protein [Labilithrix sp.]